MTTQFTVARRQWLWAIAFCAFMIAGIAPLPAQEAPREREPATSRTPGNADPRDRNPGRNADGAQGQTRRERGENPQGTPDGQSELKIAPPGNDPIARPRIMPQRWYLGVYAYNTEQGVMITDVVPGSPAGIVGLEPRDLIVNVAGFQVGYVGDNLYPLGDELQARANARGFVRLLVQNRRNNELVNIDVPLERRGSYYRRER